MAMRPKKVEKSEPPFFADSPIVSPGKRTRELQSRRPVNGSPVSASPGARAKVNTGFVRSPGFGVRPKARAGATQREKLMDQEVRRSSVIQRDESIGMELMDAPTKRTSRSGEEESDFFAEMDHAAAYRGGVSSASETPTFAQSPTEDEAVREPTSTGSRISRVSRSPGVQTSIFSSDEDSSPRALIPAREVPKLPSKLTKRTSASFLSESEDSPVDARQRFPAKFQEAPGHRSEPVKRQLFQDLSRAQSAVKFPPEDVTLTFEPLVEEEKEPQMAPESESDAVLSQDLEDLPQALIPEDPGSPQALSRSEARETLPKAKIEVEPLPVLKVTASSPDARLQAFSPDAKHRGSKVDLSSTSASTCTPSGESRFMASPSAASELSRSPWNEDQGAFKQQLEELEEQQKQIQSGLKEALQHHRRLWADELQRCQEVSKELEKALEDERRQHAEQIKEWEQRLESELNKKESQWREEVDALVQEVERLRQRCREHLRRKPLEPEPVPADVPVGTGVTSCDQDVAKMMDVLSQQLQPAQKDHAAPLSTTSKVEKSDTAKQVRISEIAEVSGTEADVTLPIGPSQALGFPSRLPTDMTSELGFSWDANQETLPAPQPWPAFSSPRGVTTGSPRMEFPTPVLVQDGTPSNSPLKRIKPKVQNFLDATPIGPPLPSFTPWISEEIAALAYSRSPRERKADANQASPWTPSLHLSAESGSYRFPNPQVPSEPVAAASPSRSHAFEVPKVWRREGFEPSLM